MYIFSVRMLISKYTLPFSQTRLSSSFSAAVCLLRSEGSRCFSPQRLVGSQRCYRLTSAAKAAVRQCLCFPQAAVITASSLTPFCIFFQSSFGSFSSLSSEHTAVPTLDHPFLPGLSDVLIYSFLGLDMSVLHADLCYDTVYCTGLWLKAGRGYSR